MEDHATTVSDNKSGQHPGFDPDDAVEMLGLTEKQRLFCDAILKGANQTKAAEAAGYRGSPQYLRAAGSKTAKSEKVRAYISWAERGGAGLPSAPADADELKRILSKHARGSDKNTSIRAAEALNRIATAERAAKPADGVSDPMSLLIGLLRQNIFLGIAVARKAGAHIPEHLIPTREAWAAQYDQLFAAPVASIGMPPTNGLTPGERMYAEWAYEANNPPQREDRRTAPDGWDKPSPPLSGIMPVQDALRHDTLGHGGLGQMNPFATEATARSKL